MGVRGLWRLLDCFGDVIHPESLRGRRVAVDASVWLAQFRSVSRAAEDEEQRILDGFMQRILKLLFFGIEPVFVFDGVASSSKAAEHHRRRLQQLETRRSFLQRRAAEILAAQQASGAVAISPPPPSDGEPSRPHRPRSSTEACTSLHRDIQRHKAKLTSVLRDSGATDVVRPAVAARHERKRSRERRDWVAPELVSLGTTAKFLEEAASFVVEKRSGERAVGENALRMSTTALFMGPRAALADGDEQMTDSSEDEEEERSVSTVPSGSTSSAVELDVESVECVSSASSVDPEVVAIAGPATSTDATLALSRSSSRESPYNSCWAPLTVESAATEVEMEVAAEASKVASTPGSTAPPALPYRPALRTGHVSVVARSSVPFELLGVVELLDCCGVPFVLSPCEADAQCASLSRRGLVDAVFTEDSDVVVHGATSVLRGFFSGSKDVVRYEQSTLAAHGLSRSVLVAMTLLLGCDYDEGVHGVGIAGALDIIAVAWVPGARYDGASGVADLLLRWVSLVNAPLPPHWAVGDTDMSPLQFEQLREHHAGWQQLLLGHQFPASHVLEAFFHATVDETTTESLLARRAPDWSRLRYFAASRGLLASRNVALRLSAVEATWAAETARREAAHTERHITDYMTRKKLPSWRYRELSSRHSGQLKFLQLLQQPRPREGGAIASAGTAHMLTPCVGGESYLFLPVLTFSFSFFSRSLGGLLTVFVASFVCIASNGQSRIRETCLTFNKNNNNSNKLTATGRRAACANQHTYSLHRFTVLVDVTTFGSLLQRCQASHHTGRAPTRISPPKCRFHRTGEAISIDSYGLEKYHSKCEDIQGKLDSDSLHIPWEIRQSKKVDRFSFFSVLIDPQFWNQFDFAMRITLFGVLLPSAIIAADVSWNPLISPFMVFSSGVLAAKVTVGEGVAYLFTWFRAGLLWLPLAVIAGETHLGKHVVGWCFYYTIALFVMAVLTDNMARRICLLLFNTCMMGILTDTDRDGIFPCRVMVDWCIGTALCFISIFIPFPRFCKNRAQNTLEQIARNTGTAFQGLVHSFWSTSNVERNLAMSKVRAMTQSLDKLLPVFEHHQGISATEFLFERTATREIREIKFNFFERLRVNLSSMVRVLNVVQDNPDAIDNCERARKFGTALQPKISDLAIAFDELVHALATAKSREDLLEAMPRVEFFKDKTEDLQQSYGHARRKLFYELNSFQLEEFVPLMSFYLFTIISFRDTVEVFQMKIKAYEPNACRSTFNILRKNTTDSVLDNIEFFKKLYQFPNRREWQRVLEAVKVSGAMILTVGFTYLIGTETKFISGPNIIAFVAGFNTVEAIQASFVRLTGCLLGTVFGFFAGTYSKTSVQRVASLCVLMFAGTFLRNDKEYGVMAVYGMFVLIPLDAVNGVSLDEAVARMNQNTFGIFIYLFVIALIFPLSPRKILLKKRRNILRKMSDALTRMLALFSAPNEAPVLNSSGLPDEDPTLKLSRSMFMMYKRDDELEDITKVLTDLKKRLKSSREMMIYAREERGILEREYPTEACSGAFSRMRRMCNLLETIWMSWNIIRSQGHVSVETQHMMDNLAKIAQDISRSFARFVRLMSCMLDQPRVNLENELTKVVLDLIEATHELHTRKSKIMVLIILESVSKYREQGSDSTTEYASPTTSVRIFPERDVSVLADLQRGQSQWHTPNAITSPVQLPKNFKIPLTSEHAEGMHALSLCLEIGRHTSVPVNNGILFKFIILIDLLSSNIIIIIYIYIYIYIYIHLYIYLFIYYLGRLGLGSVYFSV
eukprot:gene5372-3867_t